MDQVCSTLKSNALNTEQLKSALESSHHKKSVSLISPAKLPREPIFYHSPISSAKKAPQKLRRLGDKLLGIRSSLQNVKLGIKDFIVRIREDLLNSVCSISRVHYSNLLTMQQRYKEEAENARQEEKWEQRVREKEKELKSMKAHVEELQSENDAIKEKMASAHQEASNIGRILKEKKEEKVGFQNELNNMLVQMGEIKDLVKGKCQDIKSKCDAKVKVLQVQSAQTLKGKSNV